MIQPGLIEDQKSLLYIGTREQFTDLILYPTAEQCIQRGRCSDAVHIYSVAHVSIHGEGIAKRSRCLSSV